MKTAGLIAIFILVASARVAWAQEDKGEAVTRQQAALADPQLQAELRTATPALSFTTDKDKKTATVQYGVDRDDRSFLFKVSGPLSEGAATTTLATQENLANATTLELNGKRVYWDNPLSAPRLKALCEKYAHKAECSKGDMSQEGQRIFEAAKWSAWLVGSSLKVGRKEFKFVSPGDGKDHKESHTGWSGAATAGWFPSNPDVVYFVSLTARHESAYKGGDEESICTPLAGSTSTHCRSAALISPSRKAKNLLTLESRRFFGDKVAITPRLSFEQTSHAFSVELPLFIRNIEGPFNGGVSTGWDTKQHKLTFSLFVGAMQSPTK
jgi:hypothetical protein